MSADQDVCVRCGREYVRRPGRPWRLVGDDPVCPGCLSAPEEAAEPFDPAVSPVDRYVRTLRATLPLGWWAARPVVAEVRKHLEEAAQEHAREGVSRRRAERAAVARFGPVERVVAEYESSAPRGRRWWMPAGALAVLLAAAVGLVLYESTGHGARFPPGTPPPWRPVAGVTLFPATQRVIWYGANRIGCAALDVELDRPAAAVKLLIYMPGTAVWLRQVTHHNALPGRVLSFPRWCGQGRYDVTPGTYLWRYQVRWTSASRWQLPPLRRVTVVPS